MRPAAARTGQSGVTVDLNASNSKNAGPAASSAGLLRLRQLCGQARVPALLDAHARFLKANPGRKVSLEGHTDERGGREYNLALGQKRAEAVRRALVLLGVPTPAGSGELRQGKAGGAGHDEAYGANRRVELTYR
jgi:peptidoglycan-associated lipoprotein